MVPAGIVLELSGVACTGTPKPTREATSVSIRTLSVVPRSRTCMCPADPPEENAKRLLKFGGGGGVGFTTRLPPLLNAPWLTLVICSGTGYDSGVRVNGTPESAPPVNR